jgi:hypothetical protein
LFQRRQGENERNLLFAETLREPAHQCDRDRLGRVERRHLMGQDLQVDSGSVGDYLKLIFKLLFIIIFE